MILVWLALSSFPLEFFILSSWFKSCLQVMIFYLFQKGYQSCLSLMLLFFPLWVFSKDFSCLMTSHCLQTSIQLSSFCLCFQYNLVYSFHQCTKETSESCACIKCCHHLIADWTFWAIYLDYLFFLCCFFFTLLLHIKVILNFGMITSFRSLQQVPLILCELQPHFSLNSWKVASLTSSCSSSSHNLLRIVHLLHFFILLEDCYLS